MDQVTTGTNMLTKSPVLADQDCARMAVGTDKKWCYRVGF